MRLRSGMRRASAGCRPGGRSRVVLLGCVAAIASAVRPLAAAVDSEVRAAESRRVELVQGIAPAVVAIFSGDGQGGGSGVLISADGFVVTNFHVVEGQGAFLKCGLNDGRLYDAVLVGVDPTGDIALIKLLGRDDFPAAAIGDSDKVQVGDSTYALGNPFLLAADFQPTVTYGMVSGVHRYQFPANTFLEYTDCLQVDTSINPGNSGGPLFNERGELIGINGRISVEKRGRVNVGAGYAVSVNQVMNFLDHLKSGRIVDHATLGAVVATNNAGMVTVTNILEQSEAFRRGLQAGDELVSFAGRPIGTANQFKNLLGIFPAGWKQPLTYRRNDQAVDVIVRLRRLHRLAELQMSGPARGKEIPIPPGPGPDDKRSGRPDRKPPMPEAPAIPEKYASMFVERPGYANYWFNQQAQDRIAGWLGAWGDYRPLRGAWKIDGRFDKTVVQFRLSNELAAMKLGDRASVQKATDDAADEPPGTGGWLPAMQHARELLTQGLGGFSDGYYLGSEPLDGAGPRVDVLVGVRGVTSGRWYFDQASGACLGLDFAREEDVDECELRFGGLADFQGVRFPSEITLRHAGQLLGVFHIESLDAQRGAAARAEHPQP